MTTYQTVLSHLKASQNGCKTVVVSMENENFWLTDKVTEREEKSLNRGLCYIYLELRTLFFK